MEFFGREVLCHVFYLQMIQRLYKNAKHCVVTTVALKNVPVDSSQYISQTLYRFELL
jgi:hypothetical protein